MAGLDAGELEQLRAFGFVCVRGLLSPEEMRTADDELERSRHDPHVQVMERTPAEAEAAMSAQNWTHTSSASTPFLAALMEDPRVLEPARQYLGEDCIGAQSNGNSVYRPLSQWHTDMPNTAIPIDEYTGIKVHFYCEPLTAETGALRTLPGSHRNESLHADAARISAAGAAAGVAPHSESNGGGVQALHPLPGTVIETQPGDA